MSAATRPPGHRRHLYVSTACLHGDHVECGLLQRERGDLAAPHCKHCPAICLCPTCRHDGAAPRPVGRAYHSRVSPQRLHILRDGSRPAGNRAAARGPSGPVAWCGQAAWATTKSGAPVVLDPMPAVPPAGLSWCPACVGYFAESAGGLDLVAALFAGGKR